MKTQIALTIKHPLSITVDCFGCDHCKDRIVVTKKYPVVGSVVFQKLTGGLISVGKSRFEFYCSLLNVTLSDHQVNAFDLKPEECPCHFKNWRQTNSELVEFIDVPTYRFSLSSGGDLMTLEVKDESLLTQEKS